MNPREELLALEELLDQLIRGIQDVLQSGEVLSDEFQGMMAQEIGLTTQRIDQLRQEQQKPTDGLSPTLQEPEIQQAMPSSSVFGFNYDYPNQKLLVKFQGNDGVGQGPVYAYEGVQPYIFNLFKHGAAIAKTTGSNKFGSWFRGKSPSVGAAVHQFLIAGNYPYQKVA